MAIVVSIATTTSEGDMRLKVKKGGQSHGSIKLVLSKEDLFRDVWVASTKNSKVYKMLDGKTEGDVKYWLVNNGYTYTLVYS